MKQPGRSLGSVTGFIGLATGDFKRQRQVIQQEAKLAGRAVEKIGTFAQKGADKTKQAFSDLARAIQRAFAGIQGAIQRSFAGLEQAIQRARKSIRQFDQTPLGKLQKGLQGIEQQLQGIGLVAGATTFFGASQARQFRNLETQFKILIGNEQIAQRELVKLRKFADELNVPFKQVVEGAAGLVPLVKTTGADFDKLLFTAQQFAAFDPAQGFEGAQIAIKEFLSGDYTSLFRRFETGLTRTDLKSILTESGGDANKILDALSAVADQAGFTRDAIASINEADPFPVFIDEVQQLAAEAFKPLLEEFLIPAAREAIKFFRALRENNPEILAIAGGATAAVAAFVPFVGILNTTITAFKTLRAVSAGLNLSGAIGSSTFKRGAVGAGALAAGTGAGLGLVTGLANAGAEGGDFQRIRDGESAGDVVGERFKQVLVIIADGIVNFVELLTRAATVVSNVFQRAGDIVQLLNTYFLELGGRMQEFVGQLFAVIGDTIANIPGLADTGIDLLRRGSDAAGQGQRQADNARNSRSDLQQRIADGIGISASQEAQIQQGIGNIRNSVVGGLTEMLFGAAEETEQAAQAAVTGSIGPSQADIAAKAAAQYRAQQDEEIIAVVQQFNQEREALLAKSEADKLRIEEQFQQKRADIAAQYADRQVEIARDYADDIEKSLKKLQQKRADLGRDLGRGNDKQLRKREQDRIDGEIDFYRDERDAAQAHYDKLRDIRAEAQRKEQDLLLNLDFKGVFDLNQGAGNRLQQENQSFVKERQQRLQKFKDDREDLARAFAFERQERLIKYGQDLEDAAVQAQREQAQAVENRAKALMLAAEKFQKEQQLTQQAYTQDLALLQQKLSQELQLKQKAAQEELRFIQQSADQRNSILEKERQALLQQGNNLLNTESGSITKSGATRHGFSAPESAAEQRRRAAIRERNERNARSVSNRSAPATRAFATGGFASALQPALVNELRGQAERFISAGRAAQFPQMAGMFVPFQSGQVDPNTRQQAQQPVAVGPISLTIQITDGGGDPQDMVDQIAATAAATVKRYMEEVLA